MGLLVRLISTENPAVVLPFRRLRAETFEQLPVV